MTPLLPIAIAFQIGALLFFVFHLMTKQPSKSSQDYPKVGQCWEDTMEMAHHKSIFSYKYVLGVKDGYVQFEERQLVEPPTGIIRVTSLDQFLFRSRLIKEDPNPFVPEQKAAK